MVDIPGGFCISAYRFMTDQGGWIGSIAGGLIGGLMTLIAGMLAYRAGQAQAREVQEQNSYLRQQDQERSKREARRIAAEDLKTVRILSERLRVIGQDMEGWKQSLKQRSYFMGSEYVTPTYIIAALPIDDVCERLAEIDPQLLTAWNDFDVALARLRPIGSRKLDEWTRIYSEVVGPFALLKVRLRSVAETLTQHIAENAPIVSANHKGGEGH